ncbi:MAG: multiheme c-type cytochrome, partial [Chloroflexota bacterium]
MKKWIVISLGVVMAAVAGLALWSGPTPAEAQSPAGVGSGKCATCHKGVYDAWRQTWHSKMVIDAKESPGANLGNWSSPKVGGYRFDSDVKYMLGNKPGAKQYYVNSQGQRIPIGWDDKAKDWTGDPSAVPTDWVGYCAKCHTTGYD